MTGKTQRIKRILGDVVEIVLGPDLLTYAQVVPDASFQFYDYLSKKTPLVEEIIRAPLLFIIAVMDDAVTSGRWRRIGNVPLAQPFYVPPKFIQDPINPRLFSLYENGQIRSATKAECIGLERASVWYPEQVEARLRDAYAGRENQILNLQRIRD